MIIRNESFHTSDTNRLSLDTTDTFTLTLVLLWTYTSADCRKCVLTCDNLISSLKVSFCYLFDKSRDWYVYWTSTYTRFILTV